MAAILKIQNGGLKVFEKNVNIGFRNLQVITFPKIYSLHFPQKIPSELHKELDYNENCLPWKRQTSYTLPCADDTLLLRDRNAVCYKVLHHKAASCFGTYKFTSMCQFVKVGSSYIAISYAAISSSTEKDNQRLSLDYTD